MVIFLFIIDFCSLGEFFDVTGYLYIFFKLHISIVYLKTNSIESDVVVIPPTTKVFRYPTTTSKESDVVSIPPMSKGVRYLTSYNENPIGYSKYPWK